MRKPFFYPILLTAIILVAPTSVADNVYATALVAPSKCTIKPANTNKVEPLPDLVIEKIGRGAGNNFTVVVKNRGTASTPKNTELAVSGTIYKNKKKVGSIFFSSSKTLAPGKTLLLEATARATRSKSENGGAQTQGDPEDDLIFDIPFFKLKAYVDPNELIIESNEQNNKSEFRFYDDHFARTNDKFEKQDLPATLMSTELLVYPNIITTDDLTIRYTSQEVTHSPVMLTIIDVAGQKVIEQVEKRQPGLQQLTINTEKLSNGIYWLRLQSGKTTKMERIIVDR